LLADGLSALIGLWPESRAECLRKLPRQFTPDDKQLKVKLQLAGLPSAPET
jgi:hypothetical protein